MRPGQPITILVADDDPDDRLLIADAFTEASLTNILSFVRDGEELLSYLRREGVHVDASRPGIVLLDLNMPKKDGREALAEMKSDPELRNIPVVVLTTSKAEEDVLRTYDLGVAGFVVKPVSFEGLVELIAGLANYWFEIVELPTNGDA
jgi:CheY-like chemotaxis protein